MAVESATYINQLDATNPNGSSLKSEGDNHLRLLKSTLQSTFPNITGSVTVSHSDLNNITTTQAVADTSTKPATTAFVKAAIADASGINLPSQAGNSGKFLGTDGTTPGWSAVSSGLTLLSTYDAASASTIDIETGIGSTYDDYLIAFENVVMSSVSQLQMRIKKSGAYVTGSTYREKYRTDTGSGAFSSSNYIGSTGLGTSGTSIVSGHTKVLAANTAGKTTFDMLWGYMDASAGGFTQAFGFETTSAALQGVRFYVGSGTFTSGTFRLYGFAK